MHRVFRECIPGVVQLPGAQAIKRAAEKCVAGVMAAVAPYIMGSGDGVEDYDHAGMAALWLKLMDLRQLNASWVWHDDQYISEDHGWVFEEYANGCGCELVRPGPFDTQADAQAWLSKQIPPPPSPPPPSVRITADAFV